MSKTWEEWQRQFVYWKMSNLDNGCFVMEEELEKVAWFRDMEALAFKAGWFSHERNGEQTSV